jgi:hypothetical protein
MGNLSKATHVPTENPARDQWRLLAQFSYPTNIRRHLQKRGLTSVDTKTVEFIAGCVRQAEAYFAAADDSPMDISPLLLYYGATNLLAGIAGLLVGAVPKVANHGMKLRLPASTGHRIADVEVVPLNPKEGALQQFHDTFSGGATLANGTAWTVEEVLCSIPDLKQDSERCYPTALPYVIPIEMVQRSGVVLERIVPSDLSRYPTPQDAFSRVLNFDKAYLAPQCGKQIDYTILHRKLGGTELGTYSIFGQKHLQIGHKKGGHLLSPNQEIIMYMGLFALGHISRYRPEIWTPFVRGDETGEILVIERFLAICHRYLPNLLLNAIQAERIQFVYKTQDTLVLPGPPSDSDL